MAASESSPNTTENRARSFRILTLFIGRAGKAATASSGRRLKRAPYCLTYGRPMAAGGIERPITPATAIKVKTYGSVWKSSGQAAVSEAERSGRRAARALEKPNSSAAAKAPNGRQQP